jgi:hypothetical protein
VARVERREVVDLLALLLLAEERISARSSIFSSCPGGGRKVFTPISGSEPSCFLLS